MRRIIMRLSFWRIFAAFCFFIMILLNILAEVLPINGLTTGQVSNYYPNLFTPSALTFLIWGLIYLLLLLYTVYSLIPFKKQPCVSRDKLINQISIPFAVSSLANAAWIVLWHYRKISLSLIMMAVILFCLILISRMTSRIQLTQRDKYFIRIPFSIYFGWITVATIANVTAFLVSIGWNGFGLSPQVWTIIVLIIGLLIGLAVMLKNQDPVYGLTLIWAYSGIVIRHITPAGFGWSYPAIVITGLICIAFFIIAVIYLLFRKKSTLPVI